MDKMASLNPTQNLRNPSQLQPYNYKRRCKVSIHKSYKKTSLRTIYRALNATNIPNPTPMKASVKLRQYERQNKTFTATQKELAIDLNLSPRTIKREIKQAVQNGDLRIVARLGNNSEKTRTTQYESLIFIEKFPEVPLVSIKDNSVPETNLLEKFKRVGAEKGKRNKTAFVLAVGLSCESDKTASIAEIEDQLRGGALRSGLSEKELVRTIRNAIKPEYTHPFSLAKLQDWELLEPEHRRKSFLH